MYEAYIQETPERNGTFVATSYQPLTVVTSRDPEYDMAHALTKAGHPDGPIQFYRLSTPSTSFTSIHRAGRWRIELGERCPFALVRRRESRPEIVSERVAGVARG